MSFTDKTIKNKRPVIIQKESIQKLFSTAVIK